MRPACVLELEVGDARSDAWKCEDGVAPPNAKAVTSASERFAKGLDLVGERRLASAFARRLRRVVEDELLTLLAPPDHGLELERARLLERGERHGEAGPVLGSRLEEAHGTVDAEHVRVAVAQCGEEQPVELERAEERTHRAWRRTDDTRDDALGAQEDRLRLSGDERLHEHARGHGVDRDEAMGRLEVGVERAFEGVGRETVRGADARDERVAVDAAVRRVVPRQLARTALRAARRDRRTARSRTCSGRGAASRARP